MLQLDVIAPLQHYPTPSTVIEPSELDIAWVPGSIGLDHAMQGVQGISDIITIAGLVNVDFADVKAIMCNSGTAMLGVGVSSGKNRAEEAAQVSSA